MPDGQAAAFQGAGSPLTETRASIIPIAALVFLSGLLSATAALFLLALYRSIIPGGSTRILALALLVVAGAILLQAALRLRAGKLLDQAAGRLQMRLEAAGGESLAAEGLPILRVLRGRAGIAGLDLIWVPAFLVVVGFIHPAFGLAAAGLAMLFLHLGGGDGPFDRRSGTPETRGRERFRRAAVVSLRDLAQVGILALGGLLAMRGTLHVGEMVAATMISMRALGAIQGIAEERPALQSAWNAWRNLAARLN